LLVFQNAINEVEIFFFLTQNDVNHFEQSVTFHGFVTVTLAFYYYKMVSKIKRKFILLQKVASPNLFVGKIVIVMKRRFEKNSSSLALV